MDRYFCKKFLGFLCYVFFYGLLSLGLTACGSGSGPELEPVSLSFAFDRADQAFYESLLPTFSEAYPHIQIDLHPKEWDTFGGIENYRGEDVFVSTQFALPFYQAEDQILALSFLLEQDEGFDQTDFYQGALDLFSTEGKLWALPASADFMVMYYNPRLFDEAGLAYPQIDWTWDEFLDSALALSKPSAGQYGYAPKYAPAEVTNELIMFIYQHGGKLFDSLQNPSRTNFDDPLAIEALDWYVNLIEGYAVAPPLADARQLFQSYPYLWTGILNDQFAMWTGMLSERQGADWAPPEVAQTWGLAPLPSDVAHFSIAILEGYYIAADTEDIEASWAWVNFLSQQQPLRRAPLRPSIVQSRAYEQAVGLEVAHTVDLSLSQAVLISPEMVAFGDSLGLLSRYFLDILSGRKTPVEAMSEAQRTSPFQ